MREAQHDRVVDGNDGGDERPDGPEPRRQMQQVGPRAPCRQTHPELVPPKVPAQGAQSVRGAAAGAERRDEAARERHEPVFEQRCERRDQALDVHRRASAPQPHDGEVERDTSIGHGFPLSATSARAVALVTDPANQ